jgi:hypothetical protein
MSRGCSTILKSMTSKGLKRTFTFLAGWANLANYDLQVIPDIEPEIPLP